MLTLLATYIFIIFYIAVLLRISWVDILSQILPDKLTYPLLWGGLLYHLLFNINKLSSAVSGAIVGYLSLWLANQIYLLCRKQHGLGYGDMKLLAALGAWHGWESLALITLLASIAGLSWAGIKAVICSTDSLITTPQPFGPCLAVAGGITGILQYAYPSPDNWITPF